MESDYRPLRFIDRLEGNNHIVLLYYQLKYADLVIARYLLNSLKKDESCIFFTSDVPEAVDKRLSAQGIDVDSYKQANLLRIFRIERSDANKQDALNTLKQIRESATKGMKPPFRFVGRTITDTKTIEGMKLGMVLERIGHEHFDEFYNSQMCYHDISEIEKGRRDDG